MPAASTPMVVPLSLLWTEASSGYNSILVATKFGSCIIAPVQVGAFEFRRKLGFIISFSTLAG